MGTFYVYFTLKNPKTMDTLIEVFQEDKSRSIKKNELEIGDFGG